jgi:hypothetical protein
MFPLTIFGVITISEYQQIVVAKWLHGFPGYEKNGCEMSGLQKTVAGQLVANIMLFFPHFIATLLPIPS